MRFSVDIQVENEKFLQNCEMYDYYKKLITNEEKLLSCLKASVGSFYIKNEMYHDFKEVKCDKVINFFAVPISTNNKYVLEELISMYENDEFTSMIENIEEKYAIQFTFSKLIMELTKVIMNFRVCNHDKCSCQPEHTIHQLFIHNDKIYQKYLYPDQYHHLKNTFGSYANNV